MSQTHIYIYGRFQKHPLLYVLLPREVVAFFQIDELSNILSIELQKTYGIHYVLLLFRVAYTTQDEETVGLRQKTVGLQ